MRRSPMPEPVRRWGVRLLRAVVIAAAFWWIAGLVGMHTRLAVDVALALVATALLGLAADTGPGWAVSMPTDPPADARSRTVQDPRRSLLRRIIDDTTQGRHGEPVRTSAATLQRTLRAVAAHRTGQHLGIVLDPEDRTVLARHLDPDLSEYLCATTPPPIDQHRLDDLIRRIETL